MTNYLASALMISHFACSLVLAYLVARLVHNNGYYFKIKWYHKAASTYVLALPIFLVSAYLASKVL